MIFNRNLVILLFLSNALDIGIERIIAREFIPGNGKSIADYENVGLGMEQHEGGVTDNFGKQININGNYEPGQQGVGSNNFGNKNQLNDDNDNYPGTLFGQQGEVVKNFPPVSGKTLENDGYFEPGASKEQVESNNFQETNNGGIGPDAYVIGGKASASAGNFLIGLVSLKASYYNNGNLKKTHFCSGTIIGPKTVLTAASCCTERKDRIALETVQVEFGGDEKTQLKYKLEPKWPFKVHPNYKSTNKEFDFCILTMKQKFEKSNFLKIPDSSPKNGTGVLVLGYGKNKWADKADAGARKEKAFSMLMVILPANECQAKFEKPEGKISIDSQICAYTHSSLKMDSLFNEYESMGTICEGDEGAPLIYSAKRQIVGVASRPGYGEECTQATINTPNVFGDTSKVRDWIKENTE